MPTYRKVIPVIVIIFLLVGATYMYVLRKNRRELSDVRSIQHEQSIEAPESPNISVDIPKISMPEVNISGILENIDKAIIFHRSMINETLLSISSYGSIYVCNNTTVIENMDITVHGNITVVNGTLIIRNSTVRFSLDSDGQYGIEVLERGSLIIEDSTITSYRTYNNYFFRAYRNSSLSIRNSIVEYAGFRRGRNGMDSGLWIETKNLSVRNAIFRYCWAGMFILGHDHNITNITVEDCWYGIVASSVDRLYIDDVRIVDCMYGILIEDSSRINITYGNIEYCLYGINIIRSSKVWVTFTSTSICAYGIHVEDSTNIWGNNIDVYGGLYGFIFHSANNIILKESTSRYCNIYGVLIYGATNILFSSHISRDCENGVAVCYSNDVAFFECVVRNNNGTGLYSLNSSGLYIDSCIIRNNFGYGILFSHVVGGIVENSTIRNNMDEIVLSSSSNIRVNSSEIWTNGGSALIISSKNISIMNCSIWNNRLRGNIWGILVEYSSNISLYGLDMHNNPIFIYDVNVSRLLTIEISETMLDDKPVILIKNMSSGLIDYYGQVFIIASSNITVLRSQGYAYSIHIFFSHSIFISGANLIKDMYTIYIFKSENIEICGVTISSSPYGIHIHNSTDIHVIDTDIVGEEDRDEANMWYGITIVFTENTEIRGCNIEEEEYGIVSKDSSNITIVGTTIEQTTTTIMADLSGIKIVDNAIENCTIGIVISNSRSISILNNNITNTSCGIRLENCYISILNNNSISNSQIGILIISTDKCEISGQILVNCSISAKIVDSTNMYITGCSILHADVGILANYSSSLMIYSLKLWTKSYGISTYNCEEIIMNNSQLTSSLYGIHISNTTNVSIYYMNISAETPLFLYALETIRIREVNVMYSMKIIASQVTDMVMRDCWIWCQIHMESIYDAYIVSNVIECEDEYALWLHGENIEITNNTITCDNGEGCIVCDECISVVISSNILSCTGDMIVLYGSSKVYVEWNNITANAQYGCIISESRDISVNGNIFHYVNIAISITDSESVFIQENTFLETPIAILVHNTASLRVYKNSIYDSETFVYVYKSSNIDVDDNTGEQSGFYIIIDTCQDVNVRGNEIDSAEYGVCLYMSESIFVADNYIENVEISITIVSCMDVNISYNDIYGSMVSILVDSSSQICVKGNELSDQYVGIYLNSTYESNIDSQICGAHIGIIANDSSCLDVVGVVFLYTEFPIILFNTSDSTIGYMETLVLQDENAEVCVVLNRTRNITIINMTIVGFRWGIHIADSEDILIKYCNITRNNNSILITDTKNATICFNNIWYSNIGIAIQYVKDGYNEEEREKPVIVYANNIINNMVQAVDEGANVWNGTIGNYWSDYTGMDTNNDNIGDEPYIIDEDSVDYRPIMTRFEEFIPSQGPQIVIVGESVRSGFLFALIRIVVYVSDPDGIRDVILNYQYAGQECNVSMHRVPEHEAPPPVETLPMWCEYYTAYIFVRRISGYNQITYYIIATDMLGYWSVSGPHIIYI